MKRKNASLIDVNIPEETASVILNRIVCLIDKYHHEQATKDRHLTNKHLGTMGIQELSISCYLQGLNDGHQINQ